MKKIYFITILFLLISLIFSIFMYSNKKCIIQKNIINDVVNPNYVFLGDSITEYYDIKKYYGDIYFVNSGKGFDRTQNILDNMYERVYKYNPSKVILLIGINNLLYENNDEKIVEDIDKIASQIRENFQYCDIYIESIYPMNKKWENYVELQDIKNVNKKIKKLCKKNNYIYVDVFTSLLNEEEQLNLEYTDDGLHPNEKGYEIITEIIKKNVFD